MARTFFIGATLIDGSSDEPIPMTVVVEGNRIVAVAPSGQSQHTREQDQVFDIAGHVLMPGMHHCHLHAAMDDITSYMELDMKYPANYLTLIAARNLDRMLRQGFTSVIGAGSPANIDVVLKHAIAGDVVNGPRLTACGRHLCTTGESLDFHPSFWRTAFSGFGRVCDGPNEFRKTIRSEIKDGADIVKIHVTGGHGSNYPIDITPITRDELNAAVDTAHERGKKIRAHSSSKQGILACVEAGVDLIDHVDLLDAECIDAFVKYGAAITPGAHVLGRYIAAMTAGSRQEEEAPIQTSPMASPFHIQIALTLEEAQAAMDRYCEYLPLAQKAGVNILYGDDTGGGLCPHGEYAHEMVTYQRMGIDPRNALRWATRNPADFLGRSDLGAIVEGYVADLIVVQGNPLDDIAILTQPDKFLAIMKDGKFVKCRLARHDAGTAAISH